MRTLENMHGDENSASVSNIRKIAKIELEKLEARGTLEKALDRLASTAASASWLGLHAVLIAAWIAWNLGALPELPPLDPFPFGLLALCISVESLILMIVFLIRQNAMMRLADRRAHLDLQLNILTEQEATMTLRLVRQLCAHQGLEVEEHPLMHELQAPTNIDTMSEVIERHLPD